MYKKFSVVLVTRKNKFKNSVIEKFYLHELNIVIEKFYLHELNIVKAKGLYYKKNHIANIVPLKH